MAAECGIDDPHDANPVRRRDGFRKRRQRQLYERLKRRSVLVVPGEYFFYGLREVEPWPHQSQCLRLTFSQSEQTISAGLEEIGQELRELHASV